jgi:hypothetical protein
MGSFPDAIRNICVPGGLGNEEGSVFYKVGGGKAALDFYNPAEGSNKCDVVILSGQGQLSGTCHAGIGYIATFTYTLRSVNK